MDIYIKQKGFQMPRKLEGLNAELFKTWVQEEIESDEELKMLIRQAKMNIAGNKTYTTEEILEAIEKSDL
ncbi:hypothetical protein [Paenibacillus chitinolyticus]|uniref:hypothetical protein n=1 Tax=Paenibacillus TaxID=44249 RepID=UPI001C4392C1|nr:hypothetical protein [Paenibacillus chitinolyticus]MBV6714142.1 hypothetical protein [Paenibacillus chitinolyticus]